jgi:addiction module HigA family antidote
MPKSEPITPGRFLREKVLAPDGRTQDQLARAMGVSRLAVNEIANDRRAITAEGTQLGLVGAQDGEGFVGVHGAKVRSWVPSRYSHRSAHTIIALPYPR